MQANGDSFSTAYGRMLGTTAFCALTPLLVSFVPFKVLKRVFPPVVTSSTIMLIGIYLTGVGMKVRKKLAQSLSLACRGTVCPF